jgi:ribose-phosphate pyrophosphokinase
MATNSIKLLTGNSHGQLAKLVADRCALESKGPFIRM